MYEQLESQMKLMELRIKVSKGRTGDLLLLFEAVADELKERGY